MANKGSPGDWVRRWNGVARFNQEKEKNTTMPTTRPQELTDQDLNGAIIQTYGLLMDANRARDDTRYDKLDRALQDLRRERQKRARADITVIV